MLAFEFVDPEPELAKAVTAEALDRGLVLLACGLYGNVVRLLPPLAASDEELERGLDLLEEALGAAVAGRDGSS
jgi:4-aminobutyrate aminotransferase-like enzyme